MNPELLEARWRLGAITAVDLHDVASAALDAGHDFPSVIELFAMTRDELRWEGPELFERVLRDLGVGDLTAAQAAARIARDTAPRLLEDTLEVDEALLHLADLHIRTAYQYDALTWAYLLKDELDSIDSYGRSYLGRSAEEIDADVRQEAAQIVARPAE